MVIKKERERERYVFEENVRDGWYYWMERSKRMVGRALRLLHGYV